MAGVNARGKAMLTKIGNRAAAIVPLEKPITSFAIPVVNAECILDETETEVTYRRPEVADVIDLGGGETFQTYRVPVVEGKRVTGYVPLPMRYLKVWLQLSYSIVLYTNMRRLWSEEEEENTRRTSKAKAAILRQNSGAMVAQHMLARLLAVEELVTLSHDMSVVGQESVRILDEWKIRWTRDWFNTTYDKVVRSGAKFLNADPQRPENQALFEGDWNIGGDGSNLLTAPENLDDWFDGEIKGIEDVFDKTLRKQALESLKRQDDYSQHQYVDGARLPARWHEGHKPAPYFWSVKHWAWVAQGNSIWERPIDFLFYCITADPPYHSAQQLMRDVSSMLNIMYEIPQWEAARLIVTQLWMGEMTWREFVDALMQDHLDDLTDANAQTSEKRDPENVFNTLEARLVLEGYIRRHNGTEQEKPWDVEDVILWNALSRVADMKYKSGWQWIISQIVSNQKVPDVLAAAGPWWKKDQLARKQSLQNPSAEQADEDNGDNDEDASGELDTSPPERAIGPPPGPSDPDVNMQEEDNPDNRRPDERPQDTVMEDILDRPEGDMTNGAAGHDLFPPPPASSPPQLPPPPRKILNESEENALRCFQEFNLHRSIDRLETILQDTFSADHGSIIKQFINTIRVWRLTDGTLPWPAFHEFVQGLNAIRARQEAGLEQERLL